MLTPTFADSVPYCYPVGNTPAVCLTQDLPPEEKARILLLGCGDARSVLFTSYADTKFERVLDITCCDSQPVVIARNVLLYTLLLDDADGSNHARIWNTYYHFYLDAESLKLVHVQAKKLCQLAASIENWHSREYGKVLRFCDKITLRKAKEIWGSFLTLDLTKSQTEDYDKAFKEYLNASSKIGGTTREQSVKIMLHGSRSTRPADPRRAADHPALCTWLWLNGTTDSDPAIVSAAVHSNPMFACLAVGTSLMFFATNPFSGFHLATGYVPLSQDSPLGLKSPPDDSLTKAITAARLQFQSWSAAFRKLANKCLTLRFFIGDALSFCNTLEYKSFFREAVSANLYRDPFGFEPLVLDGEDYTRRGRAPILFDVIDSSNLVDHIGGINILVAASPLLRKTMSSTLYTETFAKQSPTYKELIEDTLCGDFPTIAALLGLFPAEYYANASAISSLDEASVQVGTGVKGGRTTTVTMMYNRLVWKRSLMGPAKIRFSEAGLSHLLHQVYQQMFRGESFARVLMDSSNETMKCHMIPLYHRGSFTALLRRIRNFALVDWNKMMKNLVTLSVGDTQPITAFYFEEFGVYLHMLGVFSMVTYEESVQEAIRSQPLGVFETWKNTPEFLCITLEVPRTNLDVFAKVFRENGVAVPFQCILRSGKYKIHFAALQLSFGKISTSGERYTANFQVHVAEDKSGWAGDSPLLVAFYVPAHWVLHDPDTTGVLFAMQHTLQTGGVYNETFGEDKIFYETALGNPTNVYITAHPPHQKDYPALPRVPISTPQDADSTPSVSISARLHPSAAKIVSFIRRIDIMSDEEKYFLWSGAAVSISQVSHCAINVIVDSAFGLCYYHRLKFPIPVSRSKIKLRIARQSSYIEVEAPISPYAHGNGANDFMYPAFLGRNTPVLMNMPCLDLEQLPVLDLSNAVRLQWIDNHMTYQLSSRQRILKGYPPGVFPNDVRADFKESLFQIFLRYAEIIGRYKPTVFSVSSRSREELYFVLFVSSMRLDMANRTVVLDAAVLPVTDAVAEKHSSLETKLQTAKAYTIPIDADELVLWQKAIPAWVERCRDWKHTKSCEYRAKKVIPLTTEGRNTPICSCGNGILPPAFISDMPIWSKLSEDTVRVAISPCYAVKYLDPVFTEGELATAMQMAPRCQTCRASKAKDGGSLAPCKKCSRTVYCSKECEMADWPLHKDYCKKG